MQRNPHRYQIATGYRTFYSLSLIYQPITKKRLFFGKKEMRRAMNLILETGNFGHYFFDLSLRPKNYYGGKLYGFYCRVRWQREVFSFAPWMLLRGGLVDFWGSIKTVLTHK